MAFVQDLIEAEFTGSFEEAARTVIGSGKLFSEGHGKGLAQALAELPLSKESVDKLTAHLQGPVARGFCSAWMSCILRKTQDSETLKHSRTLDTNTHSMMKAKRPAPKEAKRIPGVAV